MTSNVADQLRVNKNWELSLYELNRSPQEAITDDTEVAVSPQSLQNELMCPICLDMLKKTMTTKECLHRFCHDCIITALRSGNKECPTCRKKLVSKRSLRPDPNFDLLISKIYPSREEYDAHQRKVIEKVTKIPSRGALFKSLNKVYELQNQNRSQRFKKSQNDADGAGIVDSTVSESATNDREMPSSTRAARTTPSQPKSIPSTSSMMNLVDNKRNSANSADSLSESGSMSESSWYGPTSSDEIEVIFKPHPSESNKNLIKSTKEQSRFLKTTGCAKVSHLSKYLETRTSIDLGSAFKNQKISFDIHIARNPGNFIGLDDSESLRNVIDKYWRNNEPLELYYLSKKEEEK